MSQVLDLEELNGKALELARKEDPDYIKARNDGPWGIVETARGLYALRHEGIGPKDPVTDEKPLEILFYREKENRMALLPFADAKLTADELRELPVEKEMDLAEFIRTFGDRLERNFWMWAKVLAKAM